MLHPARVPGAASRGVRADALRAARGAGRTMQLQSVAEARERVVSASERPPLEATVDGPTARVLASMWGGDPESRIPAGAAAAEFDSLLVLSPCPPRDASARACCCSSIRRSVAPLSSTFYWFLLDSGEV